MTCGGGGCGQPPARINNSAEYTQESLNDLKNRFEKAVDSLHKILLVVCPNTDEEVNRLTANFHEAMIQTMTMRTGINVTNFLTAIEEQIGKTPEKILEDMQTAQNDFEKPTEFYSLVELQAVVTLVSLVQALLKTSWKLNTSPNGTIQV
ncbi:MAG: hypothetical protein WC269_02530 [Candidatus Gracilibacteria bacterium]|jgi:hypothetical protein